MNFYELKQLIKEIKATIPCRHCEKPYSDREIRIIGTVLNEGFFMANCRNCQIEVIINVIFKEKKLIHRPLKNRSIKPIDKDDILDMRNFLKNFNGDFATLFRKKS